MGRVAAIAANNSFGYLVDASAAIPILLTAFFLTLGSVGALLLPDSRRIAL